MRQLNRRRGYRHSRHAVLLLPPCALSTVRSLPPGVKGTFSVVPEVDYVGYSQALIMSGIKKGADPDIFFSDHRNRRIELSRCTSARPMHQRTPSCTFYEQCEPSENTWNWRGPRKNQQSRSSSEPVDYSGCLRRCVA